MLKNKDYGLVFIKDYDDGSIMDAILVDSNDVSKVYNILGDCEKRRMDDEDYDDNWQYDNFFEALEDAGIDYAIIDEMQSYRY